jgi:flagellin-specific chaperone FliS
MIIWLAACWSRIFSNDESILDEISALMIELKMGWDAMPDAYKH